MKSVHQGYEISDEAWELLAPELPGQRGQWGRVAKDSRRSINGVLWILGNGAHWRDLPARCGSWTRTYRCFRRWQKNGVWNDVYGFLVNRPEFAWLEECGACQAILHAGEDAEILPGQTDGS